MKNLSLLGNKETNYIFEYQPKSSNPLTIVMWKMTISSNSTVLNSPASVPKPGNRILTTIYISYIPGDFMVESKSPKLYLFSFPQSR